MLKYYLGQKPLYIIVYTQYHNNAKMSLLGLVQFHLPITLYRVKLLNDLVSLMLDVGVDT